MCFGGINLVTAREKFEIGVMKVDGWKIQGEFLCCRISSPCVQPLEISAPFPWKADQQHGLQTLWAPGVEINNILYYY